MQDEKVFSNRVIPKSRRYICSCPGCRNPVENHEVSIDIHRIASHCESCRNGLDKYPIKDTREYFVKDDKEERIINVFKITEGEGYSYIEIGYYDVPLHKIDGPIILRVPVNDRQ